MPELSAPLEALAAITGRVAGASLVPLALGLSLQLLKLGALSRVWHRVLQAAYPHTPLRARVTLALYLTGVGIGTLVPAKAGLVARTALAKRRIPGATYETLATTVVLDSALVAVPLGLLVIVAAGLGLLPTPPAGLSLPSPPLLGATGAVVVAAIAAASALAVCITVIRRHGARIREHARRARQGFRILGRGRIMAEALAWATIAWALRLAVIACFLTAFHLNAGPRMILTVVLVQALASLLPVTPNGVGAQQGLMLLALGGVASSGAILAFAVGMPAAIGALDLVAGIAAMAALGVRRGSLRPARATTTPASATA